MARSEAVEVVFALDFEDVFRAELLHALPLPAGCRSHQATNLRHSETRGSAAYLASSLSEANFGMADGSIGSGDSLQTSG
jgi:hypothetical protein